MIYIIIYIIGIIAMYFVVRKATKEENENWEVDNGESFVIFLLLALVPIVNIIMSIYIFFDMSNKEKGTNMIKRFFLINNK